MIDKQQPLFKKRDLTRTETIVCDGDGCGATATKAGIGFLIPLGWTACGLSKHRPGLARWCPACTAKARWDDL